MKEKRNPIARRRVILFQNSMLRWFGQHQRDLPWRKTRDPYHILVSEMMLQQTQVDRVIPKYRAFLRRFPTLQKLAAAPQRSVVESWSGLGYNNRALRLQRAAQVITKTGRGVPKTIPALEMLPGVGQYTARAIAAFAHRQDVAAIDTNQRRVIGRFFFGVDPGKLAETESLGLRIVPTGQGYPWNHALMDFGALICKAVPRCSECPVRRSCRAYPAILTAPRKRRTPAPKFLGSDRYFRGKIIESLRSCSSMTTQALYRDISNHVPITWLRFRRLLGQLSQDELLVFSSRQQTRVRLR